MATKIGDLANGQCPPWTKYYIENRHVLPPKGAYVNQSELMSYFARNLWRKLWDKVSDELDGVCDTAKDCNPDGQLATLDVDGTGEVTIQDIQRALRELLGYSVDNREETLANFLHSFTDTTRDGTVTLDDFQVFCQEIEEAKKRDDWRLSFGRSTSSAVTPETAKW